MPLLDGNKNTDGMFMGLEILFKAVTGCFVNHMPFNFTLETGPAQQ